MSKIDFDIIAKNIFGANAETYKQLAQGLSQPQMNDLMMKFQSLPNDKKQQFMKEIQQEVEKIKNNPTNNNGPSNTGVAITKGRW